jgi:hypothetical protein
MINESINEYINEYINEIELKTMYHIINYECMVYL